MAKVKKVIIAILSVLISILLIYNIYNLICIKILKHDIATINGYALLEVVSGSMEPTIHVGDMIIINTHEKDYQSDDIVTFYDSNRSFVTHRIKSIDGNDLITQGDNNNTLDDPIKKDDIVGKFVYRINGLGRLLSAFKSPFVLVMILIIGIMVCVFVSMDKEGNIILSEEEKEFQEYLKNKDKKTNQVNKKIDVKKHQ